MSGTLALLSTCAPHYLDGALRPGAGGRGRGQVLSLLLLLLEVSLKCGTKVSNSKKKVAIFVL